MVGGAIAGKTGTARTLSTVPLKSGREGAAFGVALLWR